MGQSGLNYGDARVWRCTSVFGRLPDAVGAHLDRCRMHRFNDGTVRLVQSQFNVAGNRRDFDRLTVVDKDDPSVDFTRHENASGHGTTVIFDNYVPH